MNFIRVRDLYAAYSILGWVSACFASNYFLSYFVYFSFCYFFNVWLVCFVCWPISHADYFQHGSFSRDFALIGRRPAMTSTSTSLSHTHWWRRRNATPPNPGSASLTPFRARTLWMNSWVSRVGMTVRMISTLPLLRPKGWKRTSVRSENQLRSRVVNNSFPTRLHDS